MAEYPVATRLVGRDGPLRELGEHLARAVGGEGGVVFVSGEPGIGKTRLIREFVARLAFRPRVEVLWGHCRDDEPGAPYAPFIEALRDGYRRHRSLGLAGIGSWRALLAHLLPELRDGLAPLADGGMPPEERHQLFEAVRLGLLPSAAGRSRLVVLEDLHWSDRTSLGLLHYLARTMRSDRVLIVGTYRADAIGTDHALARLIGQLTSERLLTELTLGALTQEDLTTLLADALGRPVGLPFAEAMHARIGGNPFFAEELLRALGEANCLDLALAAATPRTLLWRMPTPSAVGASIIERSARLDEPTACALRAAAIAGQRCDFELLSAITGLDEDTLVHALSRLVADGFLAEESGDREDRYRFRHALTREAIYGSVLGRERRRLHRAILTVLASRVTEGNELAPELAYHSLQAGELAAAIRHARAAGAAAERVCAHHEALMHYEAARELLSVEGGDWRVLAEIQERLAAAACSLGDMERHLRYHTEARQLHAAHGDAASAAAIDLSLARVRWQQGEGDTAFESALVALHTLEGEPPGERRDRSLARAYCTLAQLSILGGRALDSQRWGIRAVCAAAALGDDALRAIALNYLGCARFDLGQTRLGIAQLEQSLALAERGGDWEGIARANYNLADCLTRVGDLERAARTLECQERLSARNRLGVQRSLSRAALGKVELLLGNWPRTRELLDGLLDETCRDFSLGRLHAIPVWGELLRREGRLFEARALLEEALGSAPGAIPPPFLREIGATLAAVQLALAADNRPELLPNAGATMDACLARWREEGAPLAYWDMLGVGVEVYLALHREPMARDLVGIMGEAAANAACPPASARLLFAEGQLAAVEGDAALAAERFGHARDLWDSLRMPFEEAEARRCHAECLLRADSNTGRAAAAGELRAAREQFTRLGAALGAATTERALARIGAHRPKAPARPAVRHGGLTAREGEVLALVALGYSNRDIAARLRVTERTAEVHVSNILNKLGFTSRVQAASWAVERGLASAPDSVVLS